jgi:hypothetical protein
MRAVAILTLAALAACSSEKKGGKPAEDSKPADDSKPAGLSDVDVALAREWAELYGTYASAMEGAANDCARAAAAVREVTSKNADLIAKGKPRMNELRRDPAVAAFLDKNYKPKMGAALDRMAPTLDHCRGDAEVSAALAEGAFERKADQPR